MIHFETSLRGLDLESDKLDHTPQWKVERLCGLLERGRSANERASGIGGDELAELYRGLFWTISMRCGSDYSNLQAILSGGLGLEFSWESVEWVGLIFFLIEIYSICHFVSMVYKKN